MREFKDCVHYSQILAVECLNIYDVVSKEEEKSVHPLLLFDEVLTVCMNQWLTVVSSNYICISNAISITW